MTEQTSLLPALEGQQLLLDEHRQQLASHQHELDALTSSLERVALALASAPQLSSSAENWATRQQWLAALPWQHPWSVCCRCRHLRLGSSETSPGQSLKTVAVCGAEPSFQPPHQICNLTQPMLDAPTDPLPPRP